MNEQIKEYLIELLTIMGGQMEHMPRVRVPPKPGEPKIHCHCNENPLDRMSMKTQDRRKLIHQGHQLLQALNDQVAPQQVMGENQPS